MINSTHTSGGETANDHEMGGGDFGGDSVSNTCYIFVGGVPREDPIRAIHMLASMVPYQIQVPSSRDELGKWIQTENDRTMSMYLPVEYTIEEPEQYAEYEIFASTTGDGPRDLVGRLRVQQCFIREVDTEEIGFFTVVPPREHYKNFLEDLYKEMDIGGWRRDEVFLKLWTRNIEGRSMPYLRVLVKKGSGEAEDLELAEEGQWHHTIRGYICKRWTNMRLAREWELAHRRNWSAGRKEFFHPAIFMWVNAGITADAVKSAIRETGFLRDIFTVKKLKESPGGKSWLAIIQPTPNDIPEEDYAIKALKNLTRMGVREDSPVYSTGIKRPTLLENGERSLTTQSSASASVSSINTTRTPETVVVATGTTRTMQQTIADLSTSNTQLREELKRQGDQFAERLAALEDVTRAEARRTTHTQARVLELENKATLIAEKLVEVDQEINKNALRDARIDLMLNSLEKTTTFIDSLRLGMMEGNPWPRMLGTQTAPMILDKLNTCLSLTTAEQPAQTTMEENDLNMDRGASSTIEDHQESMEEEGDLNDDDKTDKITGRKRMGSSRKASREARRKDPPNPSQSC